MPSSYIPNQYYFGNYNPYLQQQVAQMQQPMQRTSNASIIWVNSLEEAQMYPVAPNSAVALWQVTEPVVYLKQADASGKPTLVTYDLVERKQQTTADKNLTDELSDKFVTRDSFDQVLNAIGDIKDELTIIKDDVYGIAGKKKVNVNEQ